jgi:hypothetical protein
VRDAQGQVLHVGDRVEFTDHLVVNLEHTNGIVLGHRWGWVLGLNEPDRQGDLCVRIYVEKSSSVEEFAFLAVPDEVVLGNVPPGGAQ